MPRAAKPLTVTRIRNAKNFPLWDGQGLHLIDRAGRLHWRLKYTRPDGRENRLALGAYPAVTLAEARHKSEDAHRQLREGTDPGAARRAEKAEQKRTVTATFERFAMAWIKIRSPGWAEQTRRTAEYLVRSYLIPALGQRDVRDIASKDVVQVLRRMDAKAPALTRKAAGVVQAVIRLAIADGAREEGRLLDLNLRDNLPKQHKGHYAAATTTTDVAAVMRTINTMPHEVTRAALLTCAYTAQRPGDLAAMSWQDVDLDAREWIIPKTKSGQSHIVPLARQVVTLVESMRRYTGGVGYVFPPLAQQKTPHLHRDSLSKALRDAGLRGKQTPHGLRATLRTIARERLGVSADVLEAQLAHAKKGDVQSAYDRTGFVEERQRVMQAWADYLDGTANNTVTPIRRRA